MQVLVRPAESDKIVQEMLNETQTLGVRRQSQVRNLVERWQTAVDLAQHKEAKAFTELYIPKVIPLVERVPHLSDLVWP